MVVNLLSPKTHSRQGTSENLKNLEDMCKNCTPITPIQCLSLCRFYKLKNELRNLHNIMDNPAYTTDFFNVLKNPTRFRVFQMIINGKGSLAKIQQELKNFNVSHSQYSISDDYIQPLITMGLVTESLGKYNATLFGICINDLLDGFDVFIQKLPSQSECYEETLLQLLLSGSKSRQEIQRVISPIIASRILKRLANSNLINLPSDRNYIFFHKSKRDPALEKLTESEIKVYQAISNDGIGVDKLAKIVGLSQRRIYNHIRHLKGKKLVFTRNIPITYSLTCDGQKLAIILQNMLQKIDETWYFTENMIQPTQKTYAATTSLHK
jgi:predicted transcriptional regulator